RELREVAAGELVAGYVRSIQPGGILVDFGIVHSERPFSGYCRWYELPEPAAFYILGVYLSDLRVLSVEVQKDPPACLLTARPPPTCSVVDLRAGDLLNCRVLEVRSEVLLVDFGGHSVGKVFANQLCFRISVYQKGQLLQDLRFVRLDDSKLGAGSAFFSQLPAIRREDRRLEGLIDGEVVEGIVGPVKEYGAFFEIGCEVRMLCLTSHLLRPADQYRTGDRVKNLHVYWGEGRSLPNLSEGGPPNSADALTCPESADGQREALCLLVCCWQQ
ncbi:unnamed protein product, partial [Polarella glacialis]